MRRTRQTTLGLLLLALVGGVGWLDHLTGVDFGFSLFYLVPIVLAGWLLPSGWVAAIVLAAAGAWVAAEAPFRLDAPPLATAWNGFTRLVIYGFLGGLTRVVRLERDTLQRLNRDLEEALAAQTELARVDPLTRLPNFRTFSEELEARLAAPGTLCVAYLDLDNFKQVNDRYGHQAGDQALRRVGELLRAAVRTGSDQRVPDLVARLGGDEFAIVFSEAEPDQARQIAERLIDRIRDLGADYPGTSLGASVGISCSRETPAGVDDLVRRADDAMYRAKGRGKGRVGEG